LYISRGGQIAGAQRQLLYLLGGLDKTKYKPIVVSTCKGDFVNEVKRLGIEYHIYKFNHWRKFINILRRYKDVRYIYNLAIQNNVSLLHCSDMWLNRQVALAGKKLGIPGVLHVRAPITPKQIRNFACRNSDVLIPVSTRIAARLSAAGVIPIEKIIKVSDAVDLKTFNIGRRNDNILRKELDIKGETVIGIAGRIEPEKKQFEFLEIAENLISQNANLKFVIIGEIKDQLYYNQMKDFINKNGMQNNVYFTGNRKDISDVLAGLDILVSLSGGSIRYEAMACGCCVVCAWSRQKSESYHLQDEKTGFVIADKVIEPVVSLLLRLSKDRELIRKIGDNAFAWAQKELGADKLVRDTEKIYADILSGIPQVNSQRTIS
jgi:glycosyltransferase involved in cell wall biosynthesis